MWLYQHDAYMYTHDHCGGQNSKKYMPLWFSTKLQEEWTENFGLWHQPGKTCYLERCWDLVMRLLIRGHRGIVQKEHLVKFLIGVLLWIVMDLSKCIFLHSILLWQFNNDFIKIQHTKWELIQSTVFLGICLDENCKQILILWLHLIILSFELGTTSWLKLETFISEWFGGQPFWFSFSHCNCLVCWQEINKQHEALWSYSALKYSDPDMSW